MKWGIMATGTIAAKFADTVMKMGGEEQLTACGSRSLEKAEGFAGRYGIRHGYGSYEALAADPEVDAVYIATPNNLHFDIAGCAWTRENMCSAKNHLPPVRTRPDCCLAWQGKRDGSSWKGSGSATFPS